MNQINPAASDIVAKLWNVLFFTRGHKDTSNTQAVWVYDMRANMPQCGKRTPFTRDYFRTATDAPRIHPARQV